MSKATRKILTAVIVVLCAAILLKFMDSMPHGMFFFMPFSFFFLLIFSLVVWTTYVCSRFSAKLKKLNRNTCQQTADEMLQMMDNWGGFTRMLLRSNMIKFGIKSNNIRITFNKCVYPHPHISQSTKKGLYDAFKSLDIWDLNTVGSSPYIHHTKQQKTSHKPQPTAHSPNQTTSKSTQPTPTKQTGYQAAPVDNNPEGGRDHGKLGEENVWFDLCKLKGLGKFDVFFDVQLKDSQFDDIVVSENGGVFLLEVKSWGGQYPTQPQNEAERRKMVKIVSYDETNGEMVKVSQQIQHHRIAFEKIFSHLQLTKEQITDILVISYPHKDTVRVVDSESFPRQYTTLAVHDLSAWLMQQNSAPLTLEQRRKLTTELRKHSNRWQIDLPASDTAKASVEEEQSNTATENATQVENDFEINDVPKVEKSRETCFYCPHCGMKLNSTAQFCGYCGKEL